MKPAIEHEFIPRLEFAIGSEDGVYNDIDGYGIGYDSNFELVQEVIFPQIDYIHPDVEWVIWMEYLDKG